MIFSILQLYVVLTGESASFWQENMVVVIILLCGGGSKLSNVWSFIILRSEKGFTSFNYNNSANFSGEKKFNEAFPGVYLLTIREKTLNQILLSNLKV